MIEKLEKGFYSSDFIEKLPRSFANFILLAGLAPNLLVVVKALLMLVTTGRSTSFIRQQYCKVMEEIEYINDISTSLW